MIQTAYINGQRPPRNLYYNEFSVQVEDFTSEKELFRHIFRSCGSGKYFINIINEGDKRLSKPLWKGEIRDKDPYLVIRMDEYREMANILGLDKVKWGEEGCLRLKKRNPETNSIR